MVTFLIPKSEFESFGRRMVEEIQHDPAKALARLDTLKTNTDKLSGMIRKLGNTIPTITEYQEFKKCFSYHLPLHNFMKKTVDFLPDDLLQELLPRFKEARVYSEHIYSDTEHFFRSIAAKIAEGEHISADLPTCLTEDELESYLMTGGLPDKDVLEKRFEQSILYFEEGKQHLLVEDDVGQVEKMLETTLVHDGLKGTPAFKGTARGIARVILDPHRTAVFNRGDILVTGMTRPEFLPFVEKAAAIVTDAGGVLCHAAIIARELKKPCIIGTEHATRTIKDGNLLEIDAASGIIRII